MEESVAQELWKRPLDFKMRYKYMVWGGDSKAYNSVWDVAKHVRSMKIRIERVWNMKNGPSQRQEEGVACQRVKKLDCSGHL